MKTMLLVIALLVFFLAGCQQLYSQEFQSQTGGFAVMLPGTPTQETSTRNVPLVVPIDTYLFSVNKGAEGAYMVAYTDFPKSHIQESTPEELLDGVRDGNVRGFGEGRLLSEEVISLSGYQGRDIKAEVAGEGILRARFFLVDCRLYQIIWVGPKENAFSRSVGEFLDSFKLLEK